MSKSHSLRAEKSFKHFEWSPRLVWRCQWRRFYLLGFLVFRHNHRNIFLTLNWLRKNESREILRERNKEYWEGESCRSKKELHIKLSLMKQFFKTLSKEGAHLLYIFLWAVFWFIWSKVKKGSIYWTRHPKTSEGWILT